MLWNRQIINTSKGKKQNVFALISLTRMHTQFYRTYVLIELWELIMFLIPSQVCIDVKACVTVDAYSIMRASRGGYTLFYMIVGKDGIS